MKCQYINTKTKCGKSAPWRSSTGTYYCDAHKKELEKLGMKFQKIKG
jgi:hypothetical protein